MKFHERRCHRCGRPYFRVNKVHVWIAQNWGHRAGWTLMEQKICCRCMDAGEARETLTEINPKWRKAG